VSELVVTAHNLQDAFDEITKELEDNPAIVVKISSAYEGKWGMARLWRSWMATTAQFMAQNGVTQPLYIDSNGKAHGSRPFNKDDAHELFTMRWLGTDEKGNRLSWAKTSKDGRRKADKGERYHALVQHEDWCLNKGVALLKPRDSEYEKIKRETMS